MHGDRVTSKWQRFYDTDEASSFLRIATSDFDTLNDLRRWAWDQGFALRQDVDLLKYASACLVSDDLRVARYPLEYRTAYGGPPEAEPPAEQSRTSSAERATPSTFRPQKSEPPPQTTPSRSAVDVDQQIATLLAAAQNGAPFCEQCEKANSGAAK